MAPRIDITALNDIINVYSDKAIPFVQARRTTIVVTAARFRTTAEISRNQLCWSLVIFLSPGLRVFRNESIELYRGGTDDVAVSV